MKRKTFLVPFLALILTIVGCHSAKRPNWIENAIKNGYELSETLPSNELIAESLGLNQIDFFDISHIVNGQYAYKYLPENKEKNTVQCFRIVVGGDITDSLIQLLEDDYGWDIYINDAYGYMWCLEHDRDFNFELDINLEIDYQESLKKGVIVCTDTILNIYRADEVWSTTASNATDWTDSDKDLFKKHYPEIDIPPFMAMGEKGAWTDEYFDWYGCISFEDHYWVDLSEQYVELLLNNGFEKIVIENGTAYRKSNLESGHDLVLLVNFTENGNVIDAYRMSTITIEE